MKDSPVTLGVVQARLVYFRNRKAVLDELISCLERYVAYHSPVTAKPLNPDAEDRTNDFVGAA